MNSYSNTCNKLGARILALIQDHPEILEIEDPFGLFKVPGFTCEDLQPSLAQAMGALAWAKQQWEKDGREAGGGEA